MGGRHRYKPKHQLHQTEWLFQFSGSTQFAYNTTTAVRVNEPVRGHALRQHKAMLCSTAYKPWLIDNLELGHCRHVNWLSASGPTPTILNIANPALFTVLMLLTTDRVSEAGNVIDSVRLSVSPAVHLFTLLTFEQTSTEWSMTLTFAFYRRRTDRINPSEPWP